MNAANASNKTSRRPPGRRRGMSIILVLALLAIALVLSYAILRTQVASVQIQSNANRRYDARQAAAAGVHIALRKMHDSGWGGVGQPIAGTLGDNSGYSVTFTAGDASLAPGDADYMENAFRVTVTSTGWSGDPGSSAAPAEHTMKVVVQLSRSGLSDPPVGWSIAQMFTVYQTGDDDFQMEVPCQIEGMVRIQGELKLCTKYPLYLLARDRYLADLRAMKQAGNPDWRPLTGNVVLDYNNTPAATRTLLTTHLGLTTFHAAEDNYVDFPHPGYFTTYQLYPGGDTYNVQALSGSLQDVTLEADPETNPLGLFSQSGTVDIYDNVTIRGTVIVRDVNFRGRNIVIAPPDLPNLDGSAQPLQLPALLVENNLNVKTDAAAAVSGLAVVGGEFNIAADNYADVSFELAGRLLCNKLTLSERSDWNQTMTWWLLRLTAFTAQQLLPGGQFYFPNYLKLYYGLNPEPELKVHADSAAVTQHFPDFSQPLFNPDLGPDDGLSWTIVRWTDSP